MPAITLFDIMSQMEDSPEKGVILTYLTSSPILQALPLETRRGGVLKWNILTENPYDTASAAYRNFSSEFSTTKVKKQPFSSNIKVAGGRFEIDEMLEYMEPEDAQLQMYGQLAAKALQLTKDTLEGDGGKGILGIKQLIANVPLFKNQLVHMGSPGTPAALTTKGLNRAMAQHNAIPGRTVIYMNHNPYLKLMENAEGNAAAGYNIRYALSEFGKKPEGFDGYPIVVLKDGKGTDIISNVTGENSNGTSVYIITYGDDNFTGFQVKNPEVKITQTDSVLKSTMVQWGIGTAARSIRCITRLDEVTPTYS